ncbi:TusE/DsrC/DsvC family sulfur relay protein [Candidatus Palibaumannia cicadellinicola]|nr:TusE/DsrC/DsvC family sulfur relay protein [Candidatus Baumannia cicadellinicola]MBS0032818.1 TusE/DsrC/DsvC family sulfur relay protein [Candidatus Baumannia cicadellinicola]MBS0032837.1 TusE/DsrC/DsvC family sulfur relay protein [Candidatus Baumannia cicadellinicola]MCJ7462104.1 TusE/DsrC/DsvC family sulfur relay protein [Candidatus Baumannia cicadellinicola]MCJ7462886.1 TusE/DsrC/DsvC family sulfur relay protein [Candidatus Baumannia cicadellinicola]
MQLNNIEIATDIKGYLIRASDWSEALGVEIARREKIELREEHWQVIYFMRSFYYEFNISPTVRMLVKSMEQKYGKNKGNSTYLFNLFPQGPAKQAAKIAGLPQPVKCL